VEKLFEKMESGDGIFFQRFHRDCKK
jgi:hypothetical protein